MKDEKQEVTLDSLHKSISKIEDLLANLRIPSIVKATERMEETVTKSLAAISMRIDKQESVTKEAIRTNENVEDAILNVLLAIRQNEYLQAWYPAQKGFPEMKVVGTHPMNEKERIAE